jgi:hypothetical protein
MARQSPANMHNEQTILGVNLQALRATHPGLAEQLQTVGPAKLDWAATPTGHLWAQLHTPTSPRPIAIASRFDPIAEAKRLIEPVDYAKHAGIVLLGLGVGYHASIIAKTMGTKGCALVIYEPDLPLLRAVLERVDHSSWLSMPNLLILDSSTDRAALLARAERFCTVMTLGTVIVTHPITRQLHSGAVNTFGQMLTDVLAYFRTNVATALVNASRTIRNLAMNLPHYVAGESTEALVNAARGYPAVCVGAGPSLAKNVDLLADPSVRKNVVLISAQTTLKPLLDRGIRPDFVTALDFHEISRRFYDGLPRLDDVTLVAEAKVNPAVIDAYPGPIRMAPAGFLDRMLKNLARPGTIIRDGATVAHLSFYLAQHLGCDPIILIGQDLGFSDGLYYCPGTAIHDVWAPELGTFGTLENMEWQRIVRHRNHLSRHTDVHSRPIFSDEQMITYLKQFERDFADAPQRVIDATQGGMPKQHTTRATLAEALREHATRPVPALPRAQNTLDTSRLVAVRALLESHVAGITELRQHSQKTLPLLSQMLDSQQDERRMERLFGDLQKIQRDVAALSPSFTLVNELNTMGVFRRLRADRALAHAQVQLEALQAQQLQRDIDNVTWLVQACDEALSIFRDALARVTHVMETSPTTQQQQQRGSVA